MCSDVFRGPVEFDRAAALVGRVSGVRGAGLSRVAGLSCEAGLVGVAESEGRQMEQALAVPRWGEAGAGGDRPEPAVWRVGPGAVLRLDRPILMAVLNVTPDSFSDGGRHTSAEAAAGAALRLVVEGADMLDVGGESTRPGSEPVPAAEQIRRVVPAIRAVRAAGVGVPISVDTTRAEVASAALDAGADAINDTSGGLDDAGMLALAARRACGVVLMHRPVPPRADRYSDRHAAPPAYGDVVAEVGAWLRGRLGEAVRAGCDAGAVLLDPGLGFGKDVAQNLRLVRESAGLAQAAGRPVLGAVSRKSFVGRAEMGPGDAEPALPADRVAGSIALSVLQLAGGVRVFRVHDVRAQGRALRAAWRVLAGGGGE